jgi:RNA polymerase sigma factor FliA
MSLQTVSREDPRIVATLPFVETLARRVAASMPSSVEIGDLIQDGVIGLIDAARRFDETRGIKFKTFAERRIRGAMIDALRRDAWPRGVRRQRRELEAARESLRRELGREPALSDLALRVGSDEDRLSRTILRITTIESTSPVALGERVDEHAVPDALLPSEPEAPDSAYERLEICERVRVAVQSLPRREQRVIGLYYVSEATMKEIGQEIGVNESRVSQLHARALRRLREALETKAPSGARASRPVPITERSSAKTATALKSPAAGGGGPAVVLPYGRPRQRLSARPALTRKGTRGATAAASCR